MGVTAKWSWESLPIGSLLVYGVSFQRCPDRDPAFCAATTSRLRVYLGVIGSGAYSINPTELNELNLIKMGSIDCYLVLYAPIDER